MHEGAPIMPLTKIEILPEVFRDEPGAPNSFQAHP